MNDEIELHWTLKVDYTFEKYTLFEALVNLCLAYNGNIPEEFLSILDSEIDTEGEISNDNITELLDNEEFMKEFRQYLCD